MDISDFSEIEEEFIKRVHTAVWCSVATVDGKQRPRSRILHPIWEGQGTTSNGPTGWIATSPRSHKARHLARNPYVSLAYIADLAKPVYADCSAEWVDDFETKKRIWELYKSAPPPLGYDPAQFFHSLDHETFGVLKLAPWRIELVTFPAESVAACPVWRRRDSR